jgi:WD40 repeat protein
MISHDVPLFPTSNYVDFELVIPPWNDLCAILSPAGYTEAVLAACFSPDGRSLASGSGDTTVRLRPEHSDPFVHGYHCSGEKLESVFLVICRHAADILVLLHCHLF